MELQCPFCNSDNVYYSKKKSVYICEDCEQFFLPEKRIEPRKVFLSYGHDKNEPLVKKIYERLKERGHQPWIDRAKIKAGQDWRAAICSGIDESSNFLAFLSNHSIRVPGVCLDEISIGVGNWNCRIQSILLEKNIEVPNSISNIQWIDMSEWDTILNTSGEEVFNKWFDQKMDKIYSVVEDPHTAVIAGNITVLQEKLNPLTSALKMRLILKDGIVGRKWIFEKINDWLNNDNAKNVLMVWGTPGAGKSVISSYLANFTNYCISSIFFEWNNASTLNAKKVIFSVIFQMACSIEDYQQQLMPVISRLDLDKTSIDEIIQLCIHEPLNRLIVGSRRRQLLIFDALDEAFSGQPVLINSLFCLIRGLPEWIRCVITSRPEAGILEKAQAFDSLYIDHFPTQIQEDIEEFVSRGVNDSVIAAQIINHSNGSFVYAKELIALYNCNPNVDFSTIPPGLSGVYYANFERLFPDKSTYFLEYRPVFEVILDAHEQLTQGDLAAFLEIGNDEIARKLRVLRSYILPIRHDNDIYLQVFHKSFPEWLTSAEAGEYQADIQQGNLMFTKHIIHQINEEKPLSRYISKYAIDHMGYKYVEELSVEKQKALINALMKAARDYGFIELEGKYLAIEERLLGRKAEFYSDAIEYYKKLTGSYLLTVANEATEYTDAILDDQERFDLISQIAFAYFYAGFADKSYKLITMQRDKYPDTFWRIGRNEATYWHVVAVSAHDLDRNEDVIKAAQKSIEEYRLQKHFYDWYISIVNLFDGYMAIGKLKEADELALNLFDQLENRYYIHVDDILQICYANLLQTEGRIMESLVYYEHGIKLAKGIQNWDYLYGSIWRELAIAKFGDRSCISALEKYYNKAKDYGYKYIVSLARCFQIIASHIMKNQSNTDKESIIRVFDEIEKIGMPGHILQAKLSLMIDGILPFEEESTVRLFNLCQGIKGYPQIVEEFTSTFSSQLSSEAISLINKWEAQYYHSISAYNLDFKAECQANLPKEPCIGQYQCTNCQAKCCYDGVYIDDEEEKRIREFVKEYPEFFADLPSPYIVDGDWPGMRSERKTAKVPFDGYDSTYPKHFTRTRCVFAMESGECKLQRVATDQQLHPWKIKPRACWSFPIPGVANNEILPPTAAGQPDPNYVDESYPGYVTFLPCVQTQCDSDRKLPWFEKYHFEIEYYRYLMRNHLL